MFTVHARRNRLDAAIEEMAATDPALAGPVGRLRCLRGVSTLTATGLCVEVADWHRFTGSTIGAYLGLVPSEFSSGAPQSLHQTRRASLRRTKPRTREGSGLCGCLETPQRGRGRIRTCDRRLVSTHSLYAVLTSINAGHREALCPLLSCRRTITLPGSMLSERR